MNIRRLLIPFVMCIAAVSSFAVVAATPTPKPGGILRYGTVSEVVGLDPHVYGGSAWKVIVGLLYSPLVQFDTSGNVVGAIASSWEQPDSRTIVFKLKPNITFHDGTPVTAEDVRFSLERIGNSATGATLGSSFEGVKVSILDAHTVQVQKPAADATMLSVLAMPEAAIMSKKWVDSEANLKMSANGTGPFRLESYEPSVRARLVRNPDYFVKGQPYLDAVDFRMIKSDEARVNALRSKSLDMIDFVPWKDIDSLRRNGSLKIDSAGGAFMNIWFNPGKKPFDNAKVRKAMAYAIDREAVAKAAFFGHGAPIYGAPTPADSPYFNPELDTSFKRDLDKAKALLAEAGYENGFDVSLIVFQGLGIYTTTAQVIQANLKEIGINLTLEPVEWATLIERKNRGDYNAMIYGVSVKLPDPDAYTYYFGSDSSYWASPVHYKDEVLEQLLKQGRELTSVQERRPIYKKVEQRLLDTSPWVFINWREQAQGYSSKVHGYHQLGGALGESSPAISMPTMWLE